MTDDDATGFALLQKRSKYFVTPESTYVCNVHSV